MNEIQNQIYLYQCFKSIFLCISIFCLMVTLWLYYSWKRKENLRIFFTVLVLGVAGSFISVQQVQAEERQVVLKMQEGTQLKYTKIYDRDDFRVFQNFQTGDLLENLEDIEIVGVEKSDEVFVQGLEGMLEEKVKEVVEGRKVAILLTKVELGGKDASKYKVDLNKKQVRLDGVVTIKKRKINLKAEGGRREYGHYNEIKYDKDMPVGENEESYVNYEIEGLLKGDFVSYPTPCEKTIEADQMPDYPPGEWKDRITVNHDGESGKNYYFNYNEVVCGTLKIEPEIIEDYSRYIEFETNRKQVYFDKDTGKLWADGKMQNFRVLLKENGKAGLYTDVCMETGEIISKDGKGLDFSKEDFKEGEEQKISLYLVHKENKVKSEPFIISVFLDTCGPEVVENTISDGMNDCEALWDTIRFHKFYGKGELGKESFHIEDRNGCGVKKSWYHIMESEGDFTRKVVQNYLDNELKREKWNLLPQSGEIEFSTEEKNYLVFIKVADYLGHEKIYVSDGIMIDWVEPLLQIKFGEMQQISETGIYGEDVELEFHVKDEKSAIAKIEVLVICGGKEITREVLLERKFIEERENYKDILLPYVVAAQENNSEDVCVTVLASDYAGNKIEKELYLQIDTVLPEVKVQCFSQSSPFQGYYSKNPIVLQILYKEKNFSKEREYLWFEAEIEGEKKIYSAVELENKFPGRLKWIEEGEKHILEITLEEGAYGIRPFVKDFVQRQTDDYVVQGEEISVCIDTKAPRILAEIVNGKENKDNLFHEDIKLHIRGRDIGKKSESSGLKEVYYIISNGKKEQKISLFQEEERMEDFFQEISVPVQEYKDGEIEIQVLAKDRAGNIGKSEKIRINIDVTSPKISVQWSTGKISQKRYYNTQQIALIEIKEKNFEDSLIKWEIKGNAKIGKWKSKGDLHYCEVVFSEDGVCGLAFSCVDKAGNQKEYEEADTFIIDRTSPVIEVFYENEIDCDIKYFNRPRVAEVVIYEQNFDEKQVEILVRDGNTTGKQPRITEFSSQKGVHKTKVFYEESGEYYLKVCCNDKAGNQAEDFQSERFCVDLELPEIKISNIKNKSANKDKVAPIIEIRDLNYQMGAFTVDIIGSNGKSLKIKKTVRRIKQGQKISIVDLPRTEETDDVYTLSVAAVDRAGNWSKKEIVFSVNRYGSIYKLDADTGKWLSMEEKNHTYLKEGKEIGIYEYNVDIIKERTITVTCDGELKNLKEGQDYTVETLETQGKWKKNYYKIKAENFKREGNYTIILNSKDSADNSMNNTSMKRKVETLPLSFTVDCTSPAIFISGIEDQGKYQSSVREIVIEVIDNLGLEGVDVQIGNRKIQYGKEELKEKNGIIKEEIFKSKRWQEIQILAIDAAKNRQQERLCVLVMPASLQKEQRQEHTLKIMMIVLLMTLLFIWKKKKR